MNLNRQPILRIQQLDEPGENVESIRGRPEQAAAIVQHQLAQGDAEMRRGRQSAGMQAMIADPMDLVNGAASPVADGAIVAEAVARYRAGKVKPLPDSGVAKIEPVAFGVSAPPAAGSN